MSQAAPATDASAVRAFMLELVLFSPLFLMAAAAMAVRFAILRRPFHAPGWTVCVVCAAVAFLLPLGWGAWLPDLLFAPRRTLAEAISSSGYNFRVVQYWNRTDFYSTELQVTAPNGSKRVFTLDGDDSKSWRVPLSINESRRIATVTLGGERVRTVEW